MTEHKVVFLAVLSLCFTVTGGLYAAESSKMERLVTVQGRGKVSAPPDIARLTIMVSEEGPKLDPVSQDVRRKMEKVLTVLKSQGVAEKDIQTVSYQVQPKEEWKGGRSNRIGYVVSNQVEAKVRDLKKTGAVLSAVLEVGANNVQGPQFDVDDQKELERKALSQAMSDAKAKASLLAQAGGASLGDVIQINESGYQPPTPRYLANAPMRMAARDKAEAQEPIAAGEETVEATVSVSFGLK